MAEKEKIRLKEREAIPGSGYEAVFNAIQQERERSMTGKIVVKSEDRQWEVTRQGKLLYYLSPFTYQDTALQNFQCFVQDIHTHSGKHRHQGGLVLFILEGKGYTTVDDDKVEWEEGDLVLLPLKPNGVAHQHFNADPDKPSKWLAFVYLPWLWESASEFTQMEVSPIY